MLTVLLILLIICVILLVLILIKLFTKNNQKETQQQSQDLAQVITLQVTQSLSIALKDEMQKAFTINRTEISSALKDNRDELAKGLKDNRHELSDSIAKFKEDLSKTQQNLLKSTEQQLDKMRETVDEKLHKTLEQRLGESFKLVSDRLESVQKGLGEMQTLANGVGDLKKVLTNVKTRGVMGEIQLGNILEQIMAPEQYAANVKTKKGSNDHVEFAIKLPGKEDGADAEVYLPIDAKFPQENYVRLQTAYEEGDLVGIDSANKELVKSIKVFAKSIKDKYIDPPNTTDFGIMFLPIEGLFAEVVRQPELVAFLQREHKIIVTGPTTLAAMLNSLQIGFKTLAIQKRSSEVWQVLGNVKTEFNKFGGVLEKAQKKIGEANKELDTLVGTRTRIMLSKLNKIDSIEAINDIGLESPEDTLKLD